MYDKVKFGKDGAQLPLAPSSDIQKITRAACSCFIPSTVIVHLSDVS